MGLSREYQLYGALAVRQELHEALLVPQQQCPALVRGEAARETDREHVVVEHAVDRLDVRRGHAAPDELLAQALARERDQPRLLTLVGAPQLLVGDVLDAFPAVGVVGVVAPARAEIAVEQVDDLAGDPGSHVHAVGDRRHRHLLIEEAGPAVAEHRARDPAVELRDAVVVRRSLDREYRHVELVRLRSVGAAHAQQLIV